MVFFLKPENRHNLLPYSILQNQFSEEKAGSNVWTFYVLMLSVLTSLAKQVSPRFVPATKTENKLQL